MYPQNSHPTDNRQQTYLLSNPNYQQNLQYPNNLQPESFQYSYPQNTSIIQASQPIYSQPIIQGQPLSNVQYTNIMSQNIEDSQQNTFIIMAQPAVFEIEDNGEKLPSRTKSRKPREIKCLSCQRKGVTNTKNVVGGGAWTIGLALFCCGCWPCVCIPCLMKDCMDVQHNCSNCGAEVGVNRYLFDD